MRVPHKLALLVALPVLAACPLTTSSDDDPDPASPDALVGFWQYTIPGDVESTIYFGGDGTIQVLDAEFGDQSCDAVSGTWTAADGVISYSVLESDGSTSTGTTTYLIEGNTLTLSLGTDDEEVFTDFEGPMPTCADYGWPTLVVFEATLGGVVYDFTDPGPNPVEESGASIGAMAASGNLTLRGRIGGSAFPCPSCQELTVELMGEGPTLTIVPGTYVGVGTVGPGDTGTALVTYTTSLVVTTDPSQRFTSDGLDSTGNEMGSVVVTVTLVEEDRIAGTVETVMWRGDGLESLSGTGRFELRYD